MSLSLSTHLVHNRHIKVDAGLPGTKSINCQHWLPNARKLGILTSKYFALLPYKSILSCQTGWTPPVHSPPQMFGLNLDLHSEWAFPKPWSCLGEAISLLIWRYFTVMLNGEIHLHLKVFLANVLRFLCPNWLIFRAIYFSLHPD